MVTKPNKPQEVRVIATNRKATHDYVIHDRVEAGLVLVGSEVKSLRDAKVVISDGWVEIRKGQGYLHKIQINEYSQANRWQHEIERVRKLLLHRHELDKLETKTTQKGFTLIPLSLYFKGSVVKVELALVTNKKQHDKRQSKKEADDKREMDRAVKRAR
ncbi:MAG: SsrA-binding protein SmpB [Myxococcota bacterium]|nr:SsrA-binding protein SmpB [Deltaproteobacteria bacterium]MDQ3338956.1 SsrA-binding protein SmpB [Myxococcota bacterium]